jgi:hypothetical protein
VASQKGYINTACFDFKTNNIRKRIDNVVLYLDEIRNSGADFSVVQFCFGVTFRNALGQ